MFYFILNFIPDLDPEEEKEQQKELAEKFKPLITWLKAQAQGTVRDGEYPFYSKDEFSLSVYEVVLSNRLVTSPCAIVADEHGYTANVEKLLSGC